MWSKKYTQCIKCETTKIKHKGHGLCLNCWMREWTKKNPERKREHRRREYLKNKQRYLSYWKEYVCKNKEARQKYWKKYYLKNKDKKRMQATVWRLKNRDRSNRIKQKYKHRKRGAVGSHTFKEWIDVKIKYNYTCQMCGKKEPEIKLTEDHIVPLNGNGTDYIENIQPLCGSCNSSKGDR